MKHEHIQSDHGERFKVTVTLTHEPYTAEYESVMYYNIGRVFVSLYLGNDVVVHISVHSILAFRSEPVWK